MKKIISVLLAAVLALQLAVPLYAAQSQSSARSIVIHEIEGGDVTMTKGTARSFKAKVNQKMANGYTVSTGSNSYCYFRLDEDSIVKASQNSKLQFGDAKGNKLSISVLSGAITADAAAQSPGNTIEVRAGNTALAIRGTKFVAENRPRERTRITMLSGSGDVNGNPLEAGEVMETYGRQNKRVYEKRKLDINENLSLPVLEAIYDNLDELIDAGMVSGEDKESLTELLNGFIEEKRAQENEGAPPPEDVENDIIRPGQEEPSGGGGGGGGSGGSGGSGGGGGAPAEVSAVELINTATGAVEINQPMTIPAGQAATLRGGATLNINSTLSINGTLNVEAAATVNIAGGAVVTNNSATTWNIAGTVNNNGTINNTASGKINLSGTGMLENRGALNNSGSFDWADGAGIYWYSGGTVSNISGLTSPGMYVYYGGAWEHMVAKFSGNYYSTLSGALGDADSAGSGTVELIGDADITVSTTIPAGVTLSVNNGVTLSVRQWLAANGIIENNGIIDVQEYGYFYPAYSSGAIFTNNGTVNLYFNGNANFSDGGVATNYGYINLLGSGLNNNGGNFTNESGGAITIDGQTNSRLHNSNGGTLTNKGSILFTAINTITVDTGTLDSSIGTITGVDGATIVIYSGSVKIGGHTYSSNDGTLLWYQGAWPSPIT